MRIFLLLALSAPSLVRGQQLQRDDPQNPLLGDPQAVEAGRKLFVGSCGGCHGPTGEGGRGPTLRDGKLIRRSSDFQMFNTIRKGIPGTDMAATNLADARIWELVTFVRALGSPAAETIIPGDAVKGERIYASSGCSNCHTISGRGGVLGPDLSNAGGSISYENLKESILKPGDRITAGYQKVVARTRDGRTIEGIARNYDNYEVQITSKDGKLYLLPAEDLADLKVTVASYMPADYSKKLSREQLTDLLAYLSKQTSRPVDLKTAGARRREGAR